MIINAIKTRAFMPPRDDLFSLINRDLTPIKDGEILVITSKIVSIWQGRCVKMSDVEDKDALIQKEAELYLPRNKMQKNAVMLTVRNNFLIPTSGIDESNANDYYILWPEEPFKTAKKIYDFIKKKYKLKKFGLIISDSHTVPLRWGTMGFALSYWGFYPLRDYRGKKDIFGKELKLSQLNIADSLATTAVLAMGEGNEQTPMAVVKKFDSIEFGNFDFLKQNPIEIDRKEDIYWPLLNAMKWEKGGNK